MISSLKLALVGALGLLNLVPVPILAAQGSLPCNGEKLPAPVNELLKSKFGNWRPKQLSDMEADDQQLWLTGPNNKECPGIAIGHFENAENLSYVLLLVPKSNSSGGHRIVVFSKDLTKDLYASKLLDHAEGQSYSGLVISKVGPDKYKDWEAAKSINLKLDGLLVEWLEKGALLYYWSVDRFKKLQVSD